MQFTSFAPVTLLCDSVPIFEPGNSALWKARGQCYIQNGAKLRRAYNRGKIWCSSPFLFVPFFHCNLQAMATRSCVTAIRDG